MRPKRISQLKAEAARAASEQQAPVPPVLAPPPGSLGFTQKELCKAARISLSLFYSLKKKGLGPKEAKMGRRRLITFEEAQRCLQDGDLLASFREQCRALLGLAQTFNKNRAREEGFRPKWDTHDH